MKTTDPHLHFYSDSRFGAFVKTIIAVVSTIFLGFPIYLFISCNLSSKAMALVALLFAFFFAVSLSFLTSAKRHEVFVATAGYCAVMVVFVGNLQQRGWATEK